jgi:GH35 family endo-1,4-beta-xylanase
MKRYIACKATAMQDILSGVTFWNITDKYTWLDQTPSAKRMRTILYCLIPT